MVAFKLWESSSKDRACASRIRKSSKEHNELQAFAFPPTFRTPIERDRRGFDRPEELLLLRLELDFEFNQLCFQLI